MDLELIDKLDWVSALSFIFDLFVENSGHLSWRCSLD